MASTIYPVVSAGGTTFAITAAAINTQYKVIQSLSAGIYTVSVSPTSVVAKVDFWNASGLIISVSTSSGSVSANLASAATYYVVAIDSNAGATVTVAFVAAALSGTTISGTLDTITTSSTYNQTGNAYVLLYGGGSGGSGSANAGVGAAGGGAGSFAVSGFILTTPISITIGTAGNGGAIGASGNSGGSTTFGSLLTATGGTAGGSFSGNGAFSSATPGSGNAQSIFYVQSIKSGSNGGGGGGVGNNINDAGVGGGSGVGTGGTGANSGASATVANGYGAGGGGGSGNPQRAGAAGSPGVVYVLRGF